MQELNLELSELSLKIDSVPAEIIDPVLTQQEILRKERLILETTAARTMAAKSLEEDEQKFKNISDFLETFDVSSYREKKSLIDKKKEDLSGLISEMKILCDEKLRNVRKQDLLLEVPCGNKYPSCKFIKDAHQAGEVVQITESRMAENAIKTNTLGAEIKNMDPPVVESHLEKYELLVNKKSDLATAVATARITIERSDATLFREQVELENLKDKDKEYSENKEAIENLKQLLADLKSKQQVATEKENEIEWFLRREAKICKIATKRERKIRKRFRCVSFTYDLLSSKRSLIRNY